MQDQKRRYTLGIGIVIFAILSVINCKKIETRGAVDKLSAALANKDFKALEPMITPSSIAEIKFMCQALRTVRKLPEDFPQNFSKACSQNKIIEYFLTNPKSGETLKIDSSQIDQERTFNEGSQTQIRVDFKNENPPPLMFVKVGSAYQLDLSWRLGLWDITEKIIATVARERFEDFVTAANSANPIGDIFDLSWAEGVKDLAKRCQEFGLSSGCSATSVLEKLWDIQWLEQKNQMSESDRNVKFTRFTAAYMPDVIKSTKLESTDRILIETAYKAKEHTIKGQEKLVFEGGKWKFAWNFKPIEH